MARLSAEIKIYITQRVACFDSPLVVSKAVKEEFKVDVARQVVEGYDPTKRAGRDLSARLRKVFEETRKQFLEDTSDIAISHKPVRLRALQRMADRAEGSGNMVLAASLYEQAAKEVGEVFTNRTKNELHGPDDQSLLPAVITIERRDARITQ